MSQPEIITITTNTTINLNIVVLVLSIPISYPDVPALSGLSTRGLCTRATLSKFSINTSCGWHRSATGICLDSDLGKVTLAWTTVLFSIVTNATVAQDHPETRRPYS